MSNLYTSGVINIPSVTGNIVITAVATPAVVSSISAVYTQSGTVYDTDSLDDLKDDLVVAATYEGGATGVIPSTDYTLSGTLAVGTSTITVSYGGKTATFTVTVTEKPNILRNLTLTTSKTLNTSTGAVENSAISTYFVSDEINVSEYQDNALFVDFIGGAVVSGTVAYKMCFYDSSHTFIALDWRSSDIANSDGNKIMFVVPSNAVYMRIAGNNTGLTAIKVYDGVDNVDQSSKITGQYYNLNNGDLTSDNNYSCCLADVTGGEEYLLTNVASGAQFNHSNTFITGIGYLASPTFRKLLTASGATKVGVNSTSASYSVFGKNTDIGLYTM